MLPENLLFVGDSLFIYNSNLMDCCAIDSLLKWWVQNAIIINSNDPTSNCNSESSIANCL
ncbi:MAG: hypothetical protein R2788_25690 [Saprospiraceae bacterium]